MSHNTFDDTDLHQLRTIPQGTIIPDIIIILTRCFQQSYDIRIEIHPLKKRFMGNKRSSRSDGHGGGTRSRGGCLVFRPTEVAYTIQHNMNISNIKHKYIYIITK
jgi:hypothetical protein